MRLDYVLYAVAIVFFIVTITAIVYSTAVESVWVVSTVVIGLAFIGVGYTQRPRPAAAPVVTASAPSPPFSPPQPQQDQVQPPQQQQVEIQQQPEPVQQAEQQPSEVTTAIAQPTVTDVVKVEEPKPAVEPIVEPAVEPVQAMAGGLTDVKGIGEKRASQLRALGILSIEDLSKASAKDLAAKLKISPKITDKWIQNAREIGQKQ
jgi:predicted flap endonuclease-1-like 5' DNA nuclease